MALMEGTVNLYKVNVNGELCSLGKALKLVFILIIIVSSY